MPARGGLDQVTCAESLHHVSSVPAAVRPTRSWRAPAWKVSADVVPSVKRSGHDVTSPIAPSFPNSITY